MPFLSGLSFTSGAVLFLLADVLHTLFRGRQSASALDFGGGVFLLNVGVMLNVILLSLVSRSMSL
ncbi:MAG: hypothetical protein EA396_14205 [Anaerolineaceae bacterium]|nr:MAG: hypothetical protein EA396_14205 [Anaerolineaceae bacterium]